MLHPVGTESAVSGDLRHTVRVLPQDQGAGAVALRNIRNAGFHIGHDLVTGSHKGLGLARFAKDILQQFQPLLIALQRVSLGGSTHGGKADRGNTAGLQDLCMGGIACIVQDDIRVQLHDLLNIEVALRIDRVAGFHQLRGDVLEHGVGNDRLEGAAIAHDIGCAALKIGHVGGQDGIWSMTTRVTLLGTSTSLPPWSMTVWVPVSSAEAAEETASLETEADSEAAAEEAALPEPPQAVRTPAALTAAIAARKERRVIFFMGNSLK